MDKKKTELIVTGVLIVIFVIVLTNSIMKIRAKTAPRPSEAITEQPANPASQLSIFPEKERPGHSTAAISKKEAREKTVPTWGRDPFTREETIISSDSGVSSLRLMGITIGSSKSMAIINNEIVNTGSKIGKFTVLKIARDRVVLTDGTENFELILNK